MVRCLMATVWSAVAVMALAVGLSQVENLHTACHTLESTWTPAHRICHALPSTSLATWLGTALEQNSTALSAIPEAKCNCKAPGTDAAACQLSGAVRDCCCDYATVERVNRDTVFPLLEALTHTAFMRYFKVSLYCDCPLWPDDGMCAMRDCSVCECEDHEVPKPWMDAENGSAAAAAATEPACDSEGAPGVTVSESAVNREVDSNVRERLLSIRDWRGFNNPWMPNDEEAVEYSYINLKENPERYTGYKGEGAAKIWQAIYSQSCFNNITDPDTCPERRVFYRLISGVHASISAHIANDYLLDPAGPVWGPNLALFEERLGNPSVKDRVENLYFTYLFVLRAVQKAGPMLNRLDYDTGMPEEDARTRDLVHQLVNSEALKKACPIPFHEGSLWKGEGAADLKLQLQSHFRNITSVMDCVGCEKCKMWGKLQLMGIATSLKVLFHDSECEAGDGPKPELIMERNEVIALFNLFERLSKSIDIVRKMSLELLDRKEGSPQAALGAIETVTESTPLFQSPFSAV